MLCTDWLLRLYFISSPFLGGCVHIRKGGGAWGLIGAELCWLKGLGVGPMHGAGLGELGRGLSFSGGCQGLAPPLRGWGLPGGVGPPRRGGACACRGGACSDPAPSPAPPWPLPPAPLHRAAPARRHRPHRGACPWHRYWDQYRDRTGTCSRRGGGVLGSLRGLGWVRGEEQAPVWKGQRLVWG